RAHQQNAADLLALQGIHGAGHRQIGLAGTRRADAEVDVVRLDRAHVALLIRTPGLDAHALGAPYHRLTVAVLSQWLAAHLQTGLLKIRVDGFRLQVTVIAGFAIQRTQHRLGRAGDGRIANQFKMIATIAHLDAEALFDQAQVFIKLAAQTGKAPGVHGLDTETMDGQGSVQIGLQGALWQWESHSIARKMAAAKPDGQRPPAAAAAWLSARFRSAECRA